MKNFLRVAVMKNGKLQGAGAGLIEWDTETEWDDLPRTEIPVGNGKTYTVSPKGSYISFTKEGFYLVDPLPFHAAFVNTEPSSSGFLWPNPNNALRYGYALLHVVK